MLKLKNDYLNMMKRLLFIVTVLCALKAFGQAKIQFDELYHDFGSVTEGEKPSHTFKFKNTGSEPLVLNSVKPSCGCTSPFWSRDTVLPGTSGEIKVHYNSNHRVGTFNKSIRITSNAVNNVDQVKIYGVVYRVGTDSLNDNAMISPKIEVSKTSYSIGEVELYKEYEVEVAVKNSGPTALEIISAQAGCGCVREEKKMQIAPGQTANVVLFVKPREKGELSVKAIIETNDKQNPYQVIDIKFNAKKSLTQDNMMFSQPGSGF